MEACIELCQMWEQSIAGMAVVKLETRLLHVSLDVQWPDLQTLPNSSGVNLLKTWIQNSLRSKDLQRFSMDERCFAGPSQINPFWSQEQRSAQSVDFRSRALARERNWRKLGNQRPLAISKIELAMFHAATIKSIGSHLMQANLATLFCANCPSLAFPYAMQRKLSFWSICCKPLAS